MCRFGPKLLTHKEEIHDTPHYPEGDEEEPVVTAMDMFGKQSCTKHERKQDKANYLKSIVDRNEVWIAWVCITSETSFMADALADLKGDPS